MGRFARGVALLAAAGVGLAGAASMEAASVDAAGVRMEVEVHRPAGPPAGAVVLAHGFLRGPRTLRGYAEAIAAQGHLAVVPALPSKVDSRANGRALAGLVARLRDGALGAPVDRVVLAGFSAGGLAVMLAAGSPGVVGTVALDPFDRPGRAGLEAAGRAMAPMVLLQGPPSFCNAYGIASPWRAAAPRLDRHRLVEGASHCDFEWPTDASCRLACGATHPAAQAVIRAEVLEAVRRLTPPGTAR